MTENKTSATNAIVDAYIAAITDEQQRHDCGILIGVMSGVTHQSPQMWGSSIVGFGTYHYQYESGREGDMCITGFSPRKGSISIYLNASGPNQDQLLSKLGKHKMGKACLKFKRLAEIDGKVLQQLIADSVDEVKRRYG